MKKKVFCIVGWSGSGKTDLTTRIIKYLVKKKILVSSIKHSHHGFEIDKKGKDSYVHLQSGSNEVAIYNRKKWALISQIQKKDVSVEEILAKFQKDTEIILIEGLKYSNFPKIEVVRSTIKKPLIFKQDKKIVALVIDKNIDYLKNIDLPTFNFSETERIGNFVLNYFRNANAL
jgi:molybdopterin-guanine dinucleotide biosynthesis protein MobB